MPGVQSEPTGARDPEPESLEEIFSALESPLLRYARKLVRCGEVAQDLVQEAFLRLHARFDTVEHPRPWLYRTIHNLAMSHHRAQHKIVVFEEGESAAPGAASAGADPLPDEMLMRLEAIGQARLCLEHLDARTRDLLRMKFEDELSYQEMSKRAGLTIGNVGYILHHALKHLAAELKKSGVGP